MASVQDISSISSYTGDAAIGGHIDAPVVIDPSPIQRFATFNFYSDQAKWEKKQKDDAEAARQIASVSAYDITSPLTQYSDALNSGLKDLQDYMMANPKALNYSSDPKGYQEMQKKINSFANLRKSATASGAVYNANKNAIDTEPDLKNKAYLQADLDTRVKELFAGGIESAQNKVLASSSPIRPDGYKVPTAKITTYEAISSAPNADYLSKFKFINLDQLASEAAIQVAGWNTPSLDETSPSFKALSPERQDLERQRDALAGKERKQIGEIATSFNSLLPEWQQAHSREDISQIQGQPTGKDTVLDIVKSANGFNSQIKQLNAMITAGKYKDPTGKVITHQFKEINVGDGLSQEELIMMHSLQESKVPIFESLEKTIHSNDNAIQMTAEAEKIRHDKAAESIDWAQLKDKQDQWKAKTSVGGETVRNAALERAKRIYSDLQGLTDANGVITPDKVRQLNTEQLKYLGVENVTTSAGVEKQIFKPLDLNGVTTDANGKQVGDKINYAIQLVNGQIKVMKDAKPGPNGKFGGDWDNTKSTNVFNVATNIVNEELTKAGSKELNSYTAIDLGDLNNGTTTNNTTTTTTSTSAKKGGSSTSISIDQVPAGVKPQLKNGKYYYNGKEIIL